MKKLGILAIAFFFSVASSGLFTGLSYAIDDGGGDGTPAAEEQDGNDETDSPAGDGVIPPAPEGDGGDGGNGGAEGGAEGGSEEDEEESEEEDEEPETEEDEEEGTEEEEEPEEDGEGEEEDGEGEEEDGDEEEEEDEEPVLFSACNSVFSAVASAGVAYGELSDTQLPSYFYTSIEEIAVRNAVMQAFAADSACQSELADVSYFTVYRQGTGYKLNVTYYDEEGEYQVYTSEAYTVSTHKDTTYDAAVKAFVKEYSKVEIAYLTGSLAAAVEKDNSYIYNLLPSDNKTYADILAAYPDVEILDNNYRTSGFCDMEGSGVCYVSTLEGFTYKGIFYGYVKGTIGLAGTRANNYVSDENGYITISYELSDAPLSTIFKAEPKDTDQKVTAAIKVGEKLIAAYDFSLTSEDGSVVYDKFPGGLTITMEIDSEYKDAENIYARYVNDDGTVTESDIPVEINCETYGSYTYCNATFTVYHFSTYVLVQTDNPFVKAPNTGVNRAGSASDSSAAVIVASLVSALGLAAFVARRKEVNE